MLFESDGGYGSHGQGALFNGQIPIIPKEHQILMWAEESQYSSCLKEGEFYIVSSILSVFFVNFVNFSSLFTKSFNLEVEVLICLHNPNRTTLHFSVQLVKLFFSEAEIISFLLSPRQKHVRVFIQKEEKAISCYRRRMQDEIILFIILNS